MIFLFPRWDMLIPWRVTRCGMDFSSTPKTQEAFGYASVTLTPSGLSMEGDWRQHGLHLAKGRHQKNQPETPLLVVGDRKWRDVLICCKRKERSKWWVPLVFFFVHENMNRLELAQEQVQYHLRSGVRGKGERSVQHLSNEKKNLVV